tara:strand:- start:1570 stop:3366 length:1797 start_codon:yes stop_codon:yes gene_type:complete
MEVAEIDVVANTKKASSQIEELKNQIENLSKEVVESNKKTEDALEQLKKTTEETSGGIKGMGVAIKAAGIGLFLKVFEGLTELFMSNQKVVDASQTAYKALEIAFNDLFKLVEGSIGPITDYFKKIFDDPQKAVADLGTAIKANMIERFNSAIEVLGYLGTAIKKVFEGDWDGAIEAASNAGKEFTDVLTGVDDSFDKTVELVKDVAVATANYTKKTTEAAAASVQMAKEAQRAELLNIGILEESDRRAEEQRQIRDEERNTITERIEANEKLKGILEKQNKDMLENAKIVERQAIAAFNLNGGIEQELALIAAKNEVKAVEATIAGFISEQKANDLALTREKQELDATINDGEILRRQEEREWNAERNQGELMRITALQEATVLEISEETKRLEAKKALYKEGTQAFADANEELVNYQAESNRKMAELEDMSAAAKIDIAKSTLNSLATIFGKESKAGKAAAIALTTIETLQSSISAYKSLAGIPVVGPALGGIAAAGALATGFRTVKEIIGTKLPTVNGVGGGDTSGGRGGSSASYSMPSIPSLPPAFNVVGTAGSNQLADAIGGQMGSPIQAYVVSGDVTTSQSLERNIIQSATL